LNRKFICVGGKYPLPVCVVVVVPAQYVDTIVKFWTWATAPPDPPVRVPPVIRTKLAVPALREDPFKPVNPPTGPVTSRSTTFKVALAALFPSEARGEIETLPALR
jgi:hypothetical protein